MNENASTTIPKGAVSRSMRMPAAPGPVSSAMASVACSRELASIKWSLPTSRGRIATSAFWNNALAPPTPAARTQSSGKLIRPSCQATGAAITKTKRTRCIAAMSRVLLARSTKPPPNSPAATTGA